jgi:hypothetical protein
MALRVLASSGTKGTGWQVRLTIFGWCAFLVWTTLRVQLNQNLRVAHMPLVLVAGYVVTGLTH